MGAMQLLVLAAILGIAALTEAPEDEEEYFEKNSFIAKSIVNALKDKKFDEELMFDLKKENQVFVNRTMSLIIKYIVKREVDNYRSRRTDAISRKIYSSLIMKIIDIAKDLPSNVTDWERIDTAHRYLMSVDGKDMHDTMADIQVFHACVRLHDVMLTAPKIIAQLGPVDELTPQLLVKKLQAMEIKPVHLGAAILIQYHLRTTVNYALNQNVIGILSTRPQEVGSQVINILKNLAAHLLPVSELLDIHLAHYSPAFKDTCPSTWLEIVST